MKGKKSKRFYKLFTFALAVWMACLPVSTAIPVAYAADTYSLTVNCDAYVSSIFLSLSKDGDKMNDPTVSNGTLTWSGLTPGTYVLNTANACGHPGMHLRKSDNIGTYGEIVITDADVTASLDIVTTNNAEVPFALNSEAELIEASINDTDNAGITYNASDKKVTIPSGTPAVAPVELEFSFKLPLTKEAEVYTDYAWGETTMVSSAIIEENGTYFRKYTCKHIVEAGGLLSLVDKRIVPKLRIVDASTGTIRFLDEADQPIADISAYADVTYTDTAWQKTGLTYYRSVTGSGTGAQVTIAPKTQYEYAGSSLVDSQVTKNADDSVTLQILREDSVTVKIKPLTVSAPVNALEWTDEFVTGESNSKNRTVAVTLTPTAEETAKGYNLQYVKTRTGGADISSLTWTDVQRDNADGKYHFNVSYVGGSGSDGGEDIYIAYRYSKAGIASNVVWNTKPVRFDVVAPTLSSVWVEANGERVWEESQSPAWLNKQEEDSCVVKLKASDGVSGVDKITYEITDKADTPLLQNAVCYADASGICVIPYTAALQGNAAEFPITLNYKIHDKAGNVSTLQTLKLSDMVRFDFTSPEVSVTYRDADGQPITDLNRWQSGDVQVVITVTDSAGTEKESISGVVGLEILDTVSGVLKDLSQNVVDNQNGTYTLRLSENAAHQLSIVAYDKAGNDSTEIKQEIRIDKNGILNAKVVLSTVSKNEDASQFTEPFTIYAQAEADSGISEMVFYVYETGTNRLLKEERVTQFQTTGNLSEAAFRYEPVSDEEDGYIVVRFMDNAAQNGEKGTLHVAYYGQKPYSYSKYGEPAQPSADDDWGQYDTTYLPAYMAESSPENLIAAWKSAPVKKSANDNAHDVDNDTQIDENAEAESIEAGTEENAEETEAVGAASDTADTDGSENRRNNTVLPLVVAGCGGAAAATGGAYWFLKKKRI